MNISIKKLDAHKRQIDIEVPADIVKQKFDSVYSQIAKNAKIPGFRPGSAPRHILEKYHSKLAYEEVAKELIPETYQQAIEKENIDVITLPEISEVQLNPASLKFRATVETRPEVKLKEYKKIKIVSKKAAVTAEDLNKTLENLQKVKKAEILDDKFARGLGYANLSELKSILEKELLRQKEDAERMNREKQIVDYLLVNSSLDVPESLVNRQLEALVEEFKYRYTRQGMSKEELEKKEPDLRKELKNEAETQVKLFLIFDEIAKKENIARDNQVSNNVMEFLLKEAEWQEAA